MARAKKVDDKAKDGAKLSIDVESFLRMRDGVVTTLTTLQDAIQRASAQYIRVANLLLGEHATGLDVESALSGLDNNPLFEAAVANIQGRASPVQSLAAPEADKDKKERKKRQHDPNAPKRPLTPYFLYMQTARPIITADLGPEAPKGDVSKEGTRRWAAMAAEDKELWHSAYKGNLRLYNARVHSYKKGNLTAKEMTDEEAEVYADQHGIGAETADAQLMGEASTAAPEEAQAEPEPTPAAKTPKSPKASRKPKETKEKAAKETSATTSSAIVPPASTTSIVPPKPAGKAPEKEAGPEKKRKRASKKGADEPVSTIEKEEVAAETPKSAKPKKKKAKTDA